MDPQIWKSKTDEEIIEASNHLNDYTEDGVRTVLSELKRRGLPVPQIDIKQSQQPSSNISHTKKCPFCAEEIQEEAIICRYCGKDFKKEKSNIQSTQGGAIILGVIILLALIYAASKGCDADKSMSESNSNLESHVATGEEGRLSTGSTGEVAIAVDERALDELNKAATAHDVIGYAQIFSTGQAFTVDNNTKALSIEQGFGKTKVRILSGPHFGKSGWVPMEWMIK